MARHEWQLLGVAGPPLLAATGSAMCAARLCSALVLAVGCRPLHRYAGPLASAAMEAQSGLPKLRCSEEPFSTSVAAPFPLTVCRATGPNGSVGILLAAGDTVWGVVRALRAPSPSQLQSAIDSLVRGIGLGRIVPDPACRVVDHQATVWRIAEGYVLVARQTDSTDTRADFGIYLGQPPCRASRFEQRGGAEPGLG